MLISTLLHILFNLSLGFIYGGDGPYCSSTSLRLCVLSDWASISLIWCKSIRNLKVAVVRSFAIDGVPAEDIVQAGEAMAEAATVVNATLQMIYLH